MAQHSHRVKLLAPLLSLLDVRHYIAAKMFVVFTVVTLSIVAVLTGLWYSSNINMSYRTTVDSLQAALSTAGQQVDSAVEDIMRLHGSLVYEPDNIKYVLRDDLNPPTYNWFNDYKRLLDLLKTMVTNLSRTLAGVGFFKKNGESCFAGSIPVERTPFRSGLYEEAASSEGSDILLITPKPAYSNDKNMPHNVTVVRTVFYNGECKALLISSVKDSVIFDAYSKSSRGNGFVLVLDNRGQYIFDSSPGLYLQTKTLIPDLVKSRTKTFQTRDYLYVTSTSPLTHWTAVAVVPISYLHGSMNGVRLQFCTILLVSLLVIACISILLSRGITRNLQALSRNMKRVSEGELTDMKEIPSKDEVGELSKVFISMVGQIQQLLEDIRQREKQKRAMEIRVLRAQVSPHFLYNALNTINYLAALQNADNIRTLSTSLIDLLQAAVRIDDSLVTVDDELRYVQQYLNIQQYRYAQNIAIEYEIDEGIKHYRVARMILQPIVENAIIHGLGNSHYNGRIRIRVWQNNTKLIFEVTDNGKGMTQQQINEVMELKHNDNRMRFSGIGLRNVDERIKLQFGQEYGLNIYSHPGLFTTVEICLPVIEGGDLYS